MNELNNLSYSEMLHLMLDGELDSSYETSLFNELSQNEELRQEMRDMLAIRESIKKDFEAFTPPASVTKSIFNSLNFSVPTTVSSLAHQGFWANLSNKLWHPLTTAFIASIITSLLFLNFYPNNSNNNSQNLAQNQLNQTPVVINFEGKTIGNNEKAVQSQNDNDNLITSSTLQSSDLRKEQLVTNIQNEEAKIIDENKANSLEFIDLVSLSSPLSMNYNNLVKPNNQRAIVIDDFHPKRNQNNHSLFLQLKSMSGTSYPNIKLDNQQNQFLSNFTISAFTPLSENWQLGLEAGQESFPMSFWDIDETDNYLYKIEQNPSLIWAGLGFKYKWNEYIEFLANSQPFAHLTIASTSVGPLFRGSLGIQFVSDNGFGIIFGIDGSSLIYQNESKLYTSNKFGLSYGMFMQF